MIRTLRVLLVSLLAGVLNASTTSTSYAATSTIYNNHNNNNNNNEEEKPSLLTLHAQLPPHADHERVLRLLEIGDFEALNEMFEGTEIRLDDADLGRDGLSLKLREFYCSSIHLGDLTTSYTTFVNETTGQDTLAYSFRAFPFDMNCFGEYTVEFLFLKISGSFDAYTDDNEVAAQVDLISPTQFGVAPPSRAVVKSCDTVIRTDGNVRFDGDLRQVLNLAKELISDFIDVQAAKIVCGELYKWDDTFFADLLNVTDTHLVEWLPPLNTTWTDTLLAERSFAYDDESVVLLDFQSQDEDADAIDGTNTVTTANATTDETEEESTSVGDLFVQLLNQADEYLGTVSVDEETGAEDLGINLVLRELFLDENGALDLSLDELDVRGEDADGDSPPNAILDTHDTIAHIVILMRGLRLTGLDTLTIFNPFETTGKHTLSNQMAWENLSVEADLTIDIQPSSLEDSILVNPNPVSVVEDITISIDLANVDMNLSLFLPVNEAKFEGLTLGSLLDSDALLACFLSALEDLQVSGLDAGIVDMTSPVLDGFISEGIDRVLSNLAEGIFVAYKPTLLRAIPGIFQGPLRAALKERILGGSGSLFAVGDASECVPMVPPEGPIDFREFLLGGEEASNLGAAGDERYGNVGSILYGFVEDFLVDPGSDGLPAINEVLVRPFTETQSGVAGTVLWEDALFEFSTTKEDGDDEDGGDDADATGRALQQVGELDNEDVDGFRFNVSVGNLRISNIDTIVQPLELLEMTNSPTILRNTISMGNITDRPLSVGFRIGMGFKDSYTEIDVSASIAWLSLFADVDAHVDGEAFFDLPLSSIMDVSCWLTTMEPVELDSNGRPVDASAPRALSIADFRASMTSLALGTDCVVCEEPGTDLLPDLMNILESTGVVDTFGGRLPEFVESVLLSDMMQTILDQRVADAPRLCPSNPLYEGEDAVPTEYDAFLFPALSAQSIDTLLFTAIAVAETSFIMFAETQRLADIEPTSPLSAQEAFDPPADIRLLDWMNVGNSTGLGDIADQVFDFARSFLGGNSTGGLFDLEDILDDLINEDGVLELETGFSFELDDLTFSIDAIRINGLEAFKLMDVFEPIGPQTLSVSAQFDLLDMEVLLSADAPSTSDPPQVITARFQVEDVSANIAIFAAFDLDMIYELELGSLLNTDSILPCILSTAYAIDIPQMQVSIGSFAAPTIEGLLPETSAVTDRLTETLYEQFRTNIEEAIPKIFDGVGRELIADFLSSPDERTCQDAVRDADAGAFLDFRDLLLPEAEAVLLGGKGGAPYGTLVSSIFGLLKDEFFVEDPNTPGLAAINEKLIRDLGESQSGTPGSLFFPGSIFNVQQNIRVAGLRAGIKLLASDLFVNNLDTFGAPVTLLDPLKGEAHLLNNDATLGVSRRLEIGLRLFLGLYGDGSDDIVNDVKVTLSMDAIRVLLKALLLVSEDAFMRFPIRDIANIQCWMAAIPAPELDSRGVMKEGQQTSVAINELVASVSAMGMNIDCIDCSGPKVSELSSLLSKQSESGASEDLTNVMNAALELITDLVRGDFFQVLGNRALNDARKQCPHSPEYDPDFEGVEYTPFEVEREKDSITFFVALIIVGASLLIATLVVVLTTKLVVRRRHRKWIASIPTAQAKALWKQQHEEDAKEAEINQLTVSMFRSAIIPHWLRLFMPVVILGNIGFFLSGHLSLGASVTILASVGGQAFKTDDFYEFAMATSTIEIWNAGGKELAILIFLFSFVWPYTKQIMTMVLWFAPPERVSVKTRGSILLWLDALAKWSMVDIFTLVVTIVAFRISIQSPDVDFLPEDLYSIDVLVIPKWGLYANMTAQLISQISSHFIIHYHRRIARHASGEDEEPATGVPDVRHTGTTLLDEDDNEIGDAQTTGSIKEFEDEQVERAIEEESKDKLCDHTFRRPHRGEADKLVARRFVNPLLIGLSVILCLLILLGCVLPSYSLNALGIVGVLVESGQGFVTANTEYSVITSMKLFFDQAALTGTAKDYIGLGSLTILLVMTVLVVPVVQSVVLLVQWFKPLTKKRRFRISILLEILQAWQYAEVYLLSLLVGSWQLGPLSEFMINPYCGALESTFAELVYYDVLKEEDAQCFRADVKVEPTFYVLVVGALLLALVNAFVMKAVSHYFRDLNGKTSYHAPETISDLNALESYEEETGPDKSIVESDIHPVPVLFTDRFRWFLYREDAMVSRQSSRESAQNSVSSVVQMEPVVKGSMSNVSGLSIREEEDERQTGRMESSSDDELAHRFHDVEESDEENANFQGMSRLYEKTDDKERRAVESDDTDVKTINDLAFRFQDVDRFQDESDEEEEKFRGIPKLHKKSSDDKEHAVFESDDNDVKTISDISVSGFDASGVKYPDTYDF